MDEKVRRGHYLQSHCGDFIVDEIKANFPLSSLFAQKRVFLFFFLLLFFLYLFYFLCFIDFIRIADNDDAESPVSIPLCRLSPLFPSSVGDRSWHRRGDVVSGTDGRSLARAELSRSPLRFPSVSGLLPASASRRIARVARPDGDATTLVSRHANATTTAEHYFRIGTSLDKMASPLTVAVGTALPLQRERREPSRRDYSSRTCPTMLDRSPHSIFPSVAIDPPRVLDRSTVGLIGPLVRREISLRRSRESLSSLYHDSRLLARSLSTNLDKSIFVLSTFF